MKTQHVLYDCEICGCLHSWGYYGDCRNDYGRYHSVAEYFERRPDAKGERVEIRTMRQRLAADRRARSQRGLLAASLRGRT